MWCPPTQPGCNRTLRIGVTLFRRGLFSKLDILSSSMCFLRFIHCDNMGQGLCLRCTKIRCILLCYVHVWQSPLPTMSPTYSYFVDGRFTIGPDDFAEQKSLGTQLADFTMLVTKMPKLTHFSFIGTANCSCKFGCCADALRRSP